MNIVIGLAAIGVSFAYTTLYDQNFYAASIGGVLLVILGVVTAWQGATDRSSGAMWPSVLALLVGVFLLGYPWFVTAQSNFQYGTSIAGLLAIIVSGYEAFAANRATPGGPSA
ncbi:MAG: hypothetical protein ACYDDF_05535 [Thermoplasmatota archaeon]